MLYPFSGLDKIDHEVVQNAARRGAKVHKICEGIMRGLGEHGVDEETQGYVESFKKWWERGHDVVMIEERFWDDETELTGQVDIVIKTDSGLALVDLKTSSKPSKTWRVQGCAYAYLANKSGHPIEKMYFIHLNKNRKAPTIYEYERDDEFWLCVHRVFNYFYGKDDEQTKPGNAGKIR